MLLFPGEWHRYRPRRAVGWDECWISFRGPIAWWLWGIVHIYFLIDFRSRMTVSINWLWSFLTYKRGARLITGDEQRKSVDMESRTR